MRTPKARLHSTPIALRSSPWRATIRYRSLSGSGHRGARRRHAIPARLSGGHNWAAVRTAWDEAVVRGRGLHVAEVAETGSASGERLMTDAVAIQARRVGTPTAVAKARADIPAMVATTKPSSKRTPKIEKARSVIVGS